MPPIARRSTRSCSPSWATRTPEFPSIEAHELVTKDFLRAELAELRTELRAETGSLRADMAALETRLTTRLGAAIGASTALLGAIGLLT